MDNKTRNAIIGALRRVWGRHPTRIEALKKGEIREFPINKDGSKAARAHVFYICDQCNTRCKQSKSPHYPKVHVDHIEPVIPISGLSLSFDEIIERMFTTLDNLQLLCEHCHYEKTQAENKERRENKKCLKKVMEALERHD